MKLGNQKFGMLIGDILNFSDKAQYGIAIVLFSKFHFMICLECKKKKEKI